MLFPPNYHDISGLNLDEFKDFLGVDHQSEPSDIVSEDGMTLMNDVFISSNTLIMIFGKSPVLHNKSPEYDYARGLVYDLFMTNLSLYSELTTLFKNSTPEKNKLN